MKRFAVVLLLFSLWAADVAAQTISLYCPPMAVRRVGRRLDLWRCDQEIQIATLIFPDGKKVVIDHEVIQPTYVRAVNARVAYVDACDSVGTAPDGTYFYLRLPQERVDWVRPKVRVARAITALGYIITPDGTEYTAEVTYPDCPAIWRGPGLRVAVAITATGTFKLLERTWPKADHQKLPQMNEPSRYTRPSTNRSRILPILRLSRS